jgi:hypothetical protein
MERNESRMKRTRRRAADRRRRQIPLMEAGPAERFGRHSVQVEQREQASDETADVLRYLLAKKRDEVWTAWQNRF